MTRKSKKRHVLSETLTFLGHISKRIAISGLEKPLKFSYRSVVYKYTERWEGGGGLMCWLDAFESRWTRVVEQRHGTGQAENSKVLRLICRIDQEKETKK